MQVLKLSGIAIMVAMGAAAGPLPAEAAAPKCKPSVGTANKFVCTTDFTAKPQQPQGAVVKHVRPLKLKAKTIPCYKSPVPGCE